MSKYKGPANHTSAFMVPRFLRKHTAQATINAVQAALDAGRGGVPRLDQLTKQQVLGLAAYVWYQRSNHSKYKYCLQSAHAYDTPEYTYYWQQVTAGYQRTGVYPVGYYELAKIKPSTIARYTELVCA